jgi:hypothetical protein
MKAVPTLTQCLADPNIFGKHYSDSSWMPWHATLKASFGEPLTAVELEFFREVSGGRAPPTKRVGVVVAAVGRGGGKDSAIVVGVSYIAITYDKKRWKLRPGEVPCVMLLAVDRDQAQVAYKYTSELFRETPALNREVMSFGTPTNPCLVLRNGVNIEIHTRDYKTVRGRRPIAAVFDEAGFWPTTESATGAEVDVAIESGMVRQPGAMLFMISSVHRRAGMFYDRFKSSYGHDDEDCLAVLGTTQQFNPTADGKLIAKLVKKDPALYGAEFLSRWRDDLQNYLTRQQVEDAVAVGVRVRLPEKGLAYAPFCDFSDGQRDSSVLSIAHAVHGTDGHGDHYQQDILLEIKAPHDTEHAIIEISRVLKEYGLDYVYGDDHSRKWAVAAFRRHKIRYLRPLDTDKKYMTRSDLYAETIALFTTGQLNGGLLDNTRLVDQYCELERKLTATGLQKIDHPLRTGRHDDLANATAGSLWLVSQARLGLTVAMIQRGLAGAGVQVGDDEPTPAPRTRYNPAGLINPHNPPQVGGERWLAQQAGGYGGYGGGGYQRSNGLTPRQLFVERSGFKGW